MTEFPDVKAKMVDASGRQTADEKKWGDHSLDLWEPFIVRKAEIDAEVARLSGLKQPNNGVRRTYFVHPRAEEGTNSFTPGIACSLDVLLPGEETAFVRQNASVIDFPILGKGKIVMENQTFGFDQYDLLTTPAMTVHKYVNDGDQVQVRLRYSNSPMLERLKIHWLDEDPPIPGGNSAAAKGGDEAEEGKERPKSPLRHVPAHRGRRLPQALRGADQPRADRDQGAPVAVAPGQGGARQARGTRARSTRAAGSTCCTIRSPAAPTAPTPTSSPASPSGRRGSSTGRTVMRPPPSTTTSAARAIRWCRASATSGRRAT